MADYNITLTANHQHLTADYLPLAAESVQYLTAKVVCETEDWTGREIKAMFGQGCTVHEISVTGGEITAKQQLNLSAGDWRVWLVGNSARDGEVIPRITTNIAHISVAPTGGTEGNPFPTIPPTVEEQLRADMGNLNDLTTKDKSSLVAAINEAAASGGAADAVTYTPQTLTTEQQKQARTNIGAYTKPASGIPKSDLAEDVQTSLAKADTAISLGLTAATPGQIIKVKTVQDGKPTEWEAVDMPSGGGEGWTLLAEQTTTEIVKEISFTLPKSVKHVVSKIWCPATGAETVNRYITVKIGATNLFYYISVNIPDKSKTSQLTVSADSIGSGYWRLSYYANKGDEAFGSFSGYNQNESVAVGVKNATYIEANTFAIMVVENDTAQQFPVGTTLKVWGY